MHLNAHIDLSNLSSIKGNLSMNSNKNYTFDPDPLEEARNLLLMDNPTHPYGRFLA